MHHRLHRLGAAHAADAGDRSGAALRLRARGAAAIASTIRSTTSASPSGCWPGCRPRSSSWSRHWRMSWRCCCCAEFALDWIRVSVNKPGAIRDSRDVGVSIERDRADLAAAAPVAAAARRRMSQVFVALGSNIDPAARLLAGRAAAQGAAFRMRVFRRCYRNRAVRLRRRGFHQCRGRVFDHAADTGAAAGAARDRGALRPQPR